MPPTSPVYVSTHYVLIYTVGTEVWAECAGNPLSASAVAHSICFLSSTGTQTYHCTKGPLARLRKLVSSTLGSGDLTESICLPPGNLSVLSSVTYRWKKPDRYVPIFNDLANVYGAYVVPSLSDD